MMAKMFYTLEEVKQALQKDEEEIKQLCREGKLREFRDSGGVVYKAKTVEDLRQEMGLGDPAPLEPDMGPSDTGLPIGLADSAGLGSSSISLSDADSGSMSGMILRDDTAAGIDISDSGVASSGFDLDSGSGASGSGSGIDVLSDSEGGADPSAATQISGSTSDQVNLEGVGSGSGLLDLTRESDDTSLGVVLDEIGPGPQGRAPVDSGADSAETMPGEEVVEATPQQRRGGQAMFVEAPDPLAPVFGGLALGGAVLLLLGLYAVASGVQGAQPGLLSTVADAGFLVVAVGGLFLSIICGVVGFIFGKVAG